MNTEFEFIEGTATVNSTTPRVTVRKAGQLVLTEAAVAMLGEGVEAVQIGYNAKSRVVGLRPAPEGGRGVLKLRAQPNGRSKLVDAKRFFAHRGLAVDKARGLEVEDFGGGIVGFRLPEEEAESPKPVKRPGGAGLPADCSPSLGLTSSLGGPATGRPSCATSPKPLASRPSVTPRGRTA